MDEVQLSGLRVMDWIRLWWAFSWRGMLILLGYLIACVVAGLLIGVFLGVPLTLLKIVSLSTVKLLLAPVKLLATLAMGVFAFSLQLRWVFKVGFGHFRLALVKIESSENHEIKTSESGEA